MEQNKNVLYISYDGLTDPLGTSQILPYIVGLSKRGYHFSVISAEKQKVYAKGKNEIKAICKENNIEWHPVEYHKQPPIISTVKDIGRMNRLAIKLHKEKDFDIVHCRSYIPAIIGQQMKQKYGVRFIFDMRGFYADERVDGNIWNLSKPHYRWVYNYFKKKEKEFLSEADYIISLTHNGKEVLQKQWQVTKPVTVIPCVVDTELFKPLANNSKLNPDSGLTAGYLGSLGTWYMLDEMLDFFKVLLKKYPGAKFKFITKEKPQIILSKALEKGIPSKHFEVVAASRTEVPKQLADVDVGIFFIKPVFSKKASSPTKQGEFMAMGIPVITNSGVGDTDFVINKYQSGMLIEDFNEVDYGKALENIEKILNLDKKNIRSCAIDFYDLKKGIEKYHSVYG